MTRCSKIIEKFESINEGNSSIEFDGKNAKAIVKALKNVGIAANLEGNGRLAVDTKDGKDVAILKGDEVVINGKTAYIQKPKLYGSKKIIIEKFEVNENFGDIVDGWSKELSEKWSKLILEMKKTLEGNKAQLDKFDATPKDVYDAVLNNLEKSIPKNIVTYKKLMKK